ncbi:SagB family peptide dehydrogenase [Amycolatopsis arida]|uniref:SagB family peptide dehydrogenase n=1 Tax=Amycolatopsis arida TaxID=587909 RepID=UPI001FBA82DD|nr:SagB family peptide dehydrogenase [Amycolatopsis arida]
MEGDPDGPLQVVSRWGEVHLGGADEVVRELLRRMSFGPVSLANIARGTGAVEQRLTGVLELLGGSLVHSLALHDGQAPLLSAVPVSPTAAFRSAPIPPGRPVRLSRFATLRTVEGELVVDAPGASYQVHLHQPLATRVAAALGVPAPVHQLRPGSPAPTPVVADIVEFLVAAAVVVVGEPDGHFAEDRDPVLRLWAHHELLFHTRSRSRHADPPSEALVSGALAAPPTVCKPVPAGKRFPLPRPEPRPAGADEPSLTALLESEHGCPELSDRMLTLEQLGGLLYRSARVRSVRPAYLHTGTSHEASQRPYFNVACLYELEIYVSVGRCAGLPEAVYHYDPLDHVLTMVNDDRAAPGILLDMAKVAAGGVRRPPALLTLTSRMERVAWIFGGAAYATTLTHVGALQQTLYLVAKAMGLSAHAVPVDASGTVDRLLRIDSPAEVSVGECVLDSLG